METIAETTPSAKTPSSRSRRTPSTSSGRKKKRPPPLDELMTSFEDLFELTDEVLGRGSEGDVVTAIRKSNGLRYAVKIIEKDGHFSRINILRELEVLHLCRGTLRERVCAVAFERRASVASFRPRAACACTAACPAVNTRRADVVQPGVGGKTRAATSASAFN